MSITSLLYSSGRAALNKKECVQVVLIQMRNIIPELQVKFPIKIPHHPVLLELLFILQVAAVIAMLEHM